VAASADYNARTGQYTIASTNPLTPITLDLVDKNHRVSVRGNVLTVELSVASQEDLHEFIEGVYYGMPLILAADFADPPIITDVSGTVNGFAFGWNLMRFQAEFHTTTQDEQTDLIWKGWQRLAALAAPEQRRVAAALHYFHVATRLERVAQAPGEFLAEALLNYAKILEVLFGESTQAMRAALRGLGFVDDAIERDFIPAAILRSKFDVAHVSLVLLDSEQLSVLQRFADRAEVQFRSLLSRTVARLDGADIALPDYDIHGADADTARIISRMRASFDALGDRP
jgi:hypothetical protein